jgi:cell division GTPase FtsZ
MDKLFEEIVSDALKEAERAMVKFPQPNKVTLKVAEESGEVVKDAIHCSEGRQSYENLRGEIVQTIAMLYRLVVEGDQTIGLAPLVNDYQPPKTKDLKAENEALKERVKELEKDIKNKELIHVGFTNGDQVKYAKAEEGAFYPDTSGNCYIPLYMLKSHEHRIETTSIEQLRKGGE